MAMDGQAVCDFHKFTPFQFLHLYYQFYKHEKYYYQIAYGWDFCCSWQDVVCCSYHV